MEIILDELTPLEFFNHGGIVKMTINDNGFIKDYNLKKKYTFFDHKEYIRFINNIYMNYINNHQDKTPNEVYGTVNSFLDIKAYIGKYVYVIDMKYDNISTLNLAKFYYSGDKYDIDMNPKDPYGIKNVNFTLIDKDDDRWDEFAKQRIERGFDDSELWSLDGTIAKFIYPRLKEFRKSAENCYPGNISKDKWIKILDNMVNGFELLANDDMKTKEEEEIENAALDLFADYFCALWN